MAGQRTALNLAGATTEELARGMMLAPAATFQPTSRMDVELVAVAFGQTAERPRPRAFPLLTLPRPLRALCLYGKKQVGPGESAFAQLRLSEPTLLLPGRSFHHSTVFACESRLAVAWSSRMLRRKR